MSTTYKIANAQDEHDVTHEAEHKKDQEIIDSLIAQINQTMTSLLKLKQSAITSYITKRKLEPLTYQLFSKDPSQKVYQGLNLLEYARIHTSDSVAIITILETFY